MGVTWVPSLSCLELRALLPARHRRHAAALQRGRSGAPFLSAASTRASTSPAGSGTAGFRPIGARSGLLRLSRRGPPRSRQRLPFRSAKNPARSRSPPPSSSRRTTIASPPDFRDRTTAVRRSACSRRRHERCHGNNERPTRPSHDLIVYELHVKGFTARANSGVSSAQPRDLRRPDRKDSLSQGTRNHRRGIDAGPAVRPAGRQLLGLHDAQLLLAASGLRGRPIRSDGAIEEFRRMVQALHDNGIEVWLDVVYNHTSEAGADGPTYSYRGIDNQSYYLLNEDRSKYRNETGCGNTLRCDHPVVRSLILESLRFWIQPNERRWLPLRPGVGLHPPVGRRPGSGSSLADCRYRRPRGPLWRAHDRRSLGHRKLSAGPRVSRA